MRTHPDTLTELDSLQSTINLALNAVRDELKSNGLPELMNISSERHPMDEETFICPPRLYDARRLALGTCSHFDRLTRLRPLRCLCRLSRDFVVRIRFLEEEY